jgi:hypothetical protein
MRETANAFERFVYRFKVLEAPDNFSPDLFYEIVEKKLRCCGEYRKSMWWESFLTGTIRYFLFMLLGVGNNNFRLRVIRAFYKIWPRSEDEGCVRLEIAEVYVFCLERFPDNMLSQLADVTLRKYPLMLKFDKLVEKLSGGDKKLVKKHYELKRSTFS